MINIFTTSILFCFFDIKVDICHKQEKDMIASAAINIFRPLKLRKFKKIRNFNDISVEI